MTARAARVLVIDDLAEEFRELLLYLLADYEVLFAETGSEGLRLLREDRACEDQTTGRGIFAVLLDNSFDAPEFAPEPMFEGREILRQIQDLDVPPIVVMISAYGDTDTVIECVQAGAFWYLTKPLDGDRVRELVRRAHAHWQLALENLSLQRDFEWRTREANLRSGVEALPISIEGRTRFGSLLGGSERMQTLYRRILQLGPTGLSILLLGEPGSGKEAVAREIHRVSPRRRGPFGSFTCTGDEAMQVLLFGTKERPGLLEAHQGGTILLREVSALQPACQEKLTRALRDSRVRRGGESFEREIDVRVIAATESRLRDLREGDVLREDLFHRVAQEVVVVPPLRDRASDLSLLAGHYLELARLRARAGEYVVATGFQPHALERMGEYTWPGNLVEFEGVVERAALRATTALIPADLLALDGRPAELSSRSDRQPAAEQAARCYAEVLEKGGDDGTIVQFRNRFGEEVLREILRLALEHTGHKGKAAGRLLGWITDENEDREYAVFRRWLTRLDVHVRKERGRR